MDDYTLRHHRPHPLPIHILHALACAALTACDAAFLTVYESTVASRMHEKRDVVKKEVFEIYFLSLRKSAAAPSPAITPASGPHDAR